MNVGLRVVESKLLSHVESWFGRVEAGRAEIVSAGAGDGPGLASVVTCLSLRCTNLEGFCLELGQSCCWVVVVWSWGAVVLINQRRLELGSHREDWLSLLVDETLLVAEGTDIDKVAIAAILR